MKTNILIALYLFGVAALCRAQNVSPSVDANTTTPTPATPSGGNGITSFTEIAPASSREEPLVGVGVVLRMKDGAILIEDIVSGSPAAADNNIHKGDRLIAVLAGPEQKRVPVQEMKLGDVVAGPGQKWVPVQGMKLGDVVAMIRGKAGSVARLVVTSAHENKEREVRLVRESLDLTTGLVLSAGDSPSETPLHFTELAMNPNSAGAAPLNDHAAGAADLIRAAKLAALKQHLEDTNKMLLESTRAMQLADHQDRDKLAAQESKLARYLKDVETNIKVLMAENQTPMESPLPAAPPVPRSSMQP